MRARHFLCRIRNPAEIGLRRTTPVSVDSGGDRGQPVDRYYIEKFLAEHTEDVRGHVLDFADDSNARKFGGAKVTQVDVLNLTADNPRATIIADLADGKQILSDTFDCILCTQVLFLIYDVHAAIATLYRILKPGGILLVTVPGVAHQICRTEKADYWRFTSLSIRRLFVEIFPMDHVEVKAYGNVLAAVAFLYGLAVEDLRRDDLQYRDPDYELSIVVRATKPKVFPCQNPGERKRTA
jgi:SAM-dependent methyltransferase